MIVQFTDVIEKEKFRGNFPPFSNNRFLHDRILRVDDFIEQPYLGGTLDGEKQNFILHFKLSSATKEKVIKIRGLNCTFKDIKPNFPILTNWEVFIDVEKSLDRDIFIYFESKAAYGEWRLQFGSDKTELHLENPQKVYDWMTCEVVFDHIALIRASTPLNDESMELPRFLVFPVVSYESIGDDFRGGVGQPYGRTIRRLKTLSVQFARVKAYLIDELYNRVGLTEPHFVVPYPENIYNVPPMWATLSNPPEFTKRDENDWYWNTKLTWKEAY